MKVDEAAKEVKISGSISDISLNGCGFLFKSNSTTTNVNKRKIFVCFQDSKGEEMKISSQVCNSRNEQGVVSVGIQFLEDHEVFTTTP